MKKQPKWCDYPDATNGVMGCWSLISTMEKKETRQEEECKGCECYKEVKK